MNPLEPTKKRIARELALQILFQIEFSTENRPSISDFLGLFEERFEPEVIRFASSMVSAIEATRTEIDSLISRYARHWKIERMNIVDRNVLRMGIYELTQSEEHLSPAIVVNEAVEIVKKYSGPESYAFVNGILDQIAKENGWNSKT